MNLMDQFIGRSVERPLVLYLSSPFPLMSFLSSATALHVGNNISVFAFFLAGWPSPSSIKGVYHEIGKRDIVVAAWHSIADYFADRLVQPLI